MRRVWLLLSIIPLAVACRDTAPTSPPVGASPTTLIDPPMPVPLPVPVRIDLGTLGGRSSYASDINSDGTVVGYSENGAGLHRAFRWTALGGMTDLGTYPGRDWSEAFSITDDGRILGVYGTSGSYDRTPVVWSPDGTITVLDIPPLPDAQLSWPSDFNERGDVVGSDVIATQHAWIWNQTQGKYDITANVPGGSREGGASEIDAAGLVVGSTTANTCFPPRASCWHAFLYSVETGYRDIGTPGDDPNAIVTGMGLNDGPTIVGHTTVRGISYAYRWTEGEGFTLLPSGSWGYATSINAEGLSVGVSWDPTLVAAQATAWPRSGGAIRLSPDDVNPQLATSVNDAGMVVGWSAQSGGGNHATLWLLGPASGALAASARNARKLILAVGSASAATAAAAAADAKANACLSDINALVSRGALFACVSQSAAAR